MLLMKICFLADSESIHTKRWCNHFVEKGHDVSLISFKSTCYIQNIKFYYVDAGGIMVKGGNWKVLLKATEIKKIVNKISPDILHAHYATSYGVVGAMINYHPYIITALGSDVLISPQKSFVYRLLLKYAFKKANWITVMADHMKFPVLKLGNFNAKTDVVPFGIDTKLFNPQDRVLDKNKFVITSTRNFEDVYNIPHLLRSVAKIYSQINGIELNLIGDGTKRKDIEELVKKLGLEKITTFYGRLSQPEIVQILKHTNVFVSVSLSDGNNISLNEAMACGCLPIVTDIPANTQWVTNQENGFLVDVDDVDGLADLLLKTFKDFDKLSSKAFDLNQKIIADKADWYKNLKIVEDKYKELLNE